MHQAAYFPVIPTCMERNDLMIRVSRVKEAAQIPTDFASGVKEFDPKDLCSWFTDIWISAYPYIFSFSPVFVVCIEYYN